MFGKIASQLIFNAAFSVSALTLRFLVEINSRVSVPELQLQTRANAPGQFANLRQTSFLRAINVAYAMVADATTVLRRMIRKGVGNVSECYRVDQKTCGHSGHCQLYEGSLHFKTLSPKASMC
ncbi:hypothetical protein UP10_16870 [Bradyrhizobium sp. LTSPM299]|nr:hypothetical protein UP10_16870 [Bradyrhizobium sp. LTSPM299]